MQNRQAKRAEAELKAVPEDVLALYHAEQGRKEQVARMLAAFTDKSISDIAALQPPPDLVAFVLDMVQILLHMPLVKVQTPPVRASGWPRPALGSV